MSTRLTSRLFAYGSLQPGGSNAHVISGIGGEWRPATVRGHVRVIGSGVNRGYPVLVLDDAGPVVHGHVLTSDRLGDNWPMLDAFEGEDYHRVLTTVTTADGERLVAQVYVLADP